MLITFYNIFGRFYYLNVVIEKIIELLTFKFRLDFCLKFLLLFFADVLDHDVVIVVYVLENHLVILQIVIKYRLLFLFVEVIIEGDDLGPVLALPLLFLLHLVSHANFASPRSQALVLLVEV